MKPLPPLNYAIWVTANNYRWFRIRVVYMSDTCTVYRSCRNCDIDIPRPYPFHKIFLDWKITLDGNEKEVVY